MINPKVEEPVEVEEVPDRTKKSMQPQFKGGWVKKTNKKAIEDPAFIWSCEFLNGETYKFLSSCNDGNVKM